MIQLASRTLVNYLCKRDVVTQEDKEIYLYGYEIMFSNILGFIITVLLGLLFQSILYALLFYLVFVSLRQYTGGLHANTYLRCNLLYSVIVASVLGTTVLLAPLWQWYYSLIVFVLYFIILYYYAPLDNENKRLTLPEKIKYKKISFILSGVWAAIAIGAGVFLPKAGLVVTVTMLSVALLLYIGVKFEKRKVKQNETKRENDECSS